MLCFCIMMFLWWKTKENYQKKIDSLPSKVIVLNFLKINFKNLNNKSQKLYRFCHKWDFTPLYQELSSCPLFFYINFCYCSFCRKLVFTQDSAKHLLYCSGVNESEIKQADYGIALIRACVSELCQHLMVLLSWHADFCKESLYLRASSE